MKSRGFCCGYAYILQLQNSPAFESGELEEESVVSKMEPTVADGKRYNINDYNLDDIIAVGYRVNSKKAMMFRLPPICSLVFKIISARRLWLVYIPDGVKEKIIVS